jgi:hypothetical protein
MQIDPPSPFKEIGIDPNLPAQGKPHPKSNFDNHAVIEKDGVVYDPSYGKQFNSRVAWEDGSVAVFYRSIDAQNPTNDVKGVLQTIWTPVND